ncbi:NAD(P)-dependent oxidoreductase [Holzapfeliella sp. JNUCC 80]
MNILIGVPESNSNLDGDAIKAAVEKSAQKYDFKSYLSTENLSKEQLDNIDVLIGNNIAVLNQLLDSEQSKLKWVQALSAGIDNFPLKKIEDKKIILSTVNGIHAEPISESVIGMILSLYRGVAESANKRHWFKPTHMLKMLQGKKVVIFGTGHIGGRISEILTVFHANVVGVNHSGHDARYFEQVVSTADSKDAIKDADIVINALPLTPQTTNLFNYDFFSQVTAQPLFVNIGRGPSANTDDLARLMQDHKLGALALDVTEPEPLPDNHQLWTMDNVLITPHISGIHAEYLDEAIDIFNENLEHFRQDGTIKINQVDFDKGY